MAHVSQERRPGAVARGSGEPPIVVTLSHPSRAARPDLAAQKNERYLAAVRRAGGDPIPLYPDGRGRAIPAALQRMAGLLLSGGADLDPALYGEPPDGAVSLEPERDSLELAAWQEAATRRLPVLGLCRGFQAINVFSGGRLIQHVDGHAGPSYLEGEPLTHPLRLVPGSRLARVLRPSDPAGGVLLVNSYHHQAIRAGQLAPGLVAAGFSPHPQGEIVEAFEIDEADRFVVGVQCHPERLESTPGEFARLFRAFVAAARRADPGRPAVGPAVQAESAAIG